MDASDRLEQMLEDLVQIVETAKAVPMSASCVINRSEVLEILHQVRADLAEELEESRRLMAEREDVIAQARRDAQRHIEEARRERGTMLSGTEMGREAERIRSEALREASRIREDADAYVDDRLANFEVVLTKTLQAVGRGRAKLGGRDPMDELGQHVAEQDAVDAANRADYDFNERDHRDLAETEFSTSRSGSGRRGTGEYQREPERQPEYGTGEFPQYTDEGYEAQQPVYQEPAYQEPAYQEAAYQEAGYQEVQYQDGAGYQEDAYAAAAVGGYADPHTGYLQEPDLSHEYAQAEMSGVFQRPDFSQVGATQGGYGYEQVPATQYAGYGDQYPVQAYGAQYGQPGAEYGGEYGGYQTGEEQQQHYQQQQAGAESSGFFDTGMIDVRQFRDDPYQR